jgi:GGDEF domain-containing protein
MREQKTWAYLDIKLQHFDAFKDVYGFVAGNDVLRFMALLMGEVVDELGTPNDFLGHTGSDNFVLITYSDKVEALVKRLSERFAEEVPTHYSFIDRERGFMMKEEEKIPLMSLAVGWVTNAKRQFADIREITELAAESRRHGGAPQASDVTTEW